METTYSTILSLLFIVYCPIIVDCVHFQLQRQFGSLVDQEIFIWLATLANHIHWHWEDKLLAFILAGSIYLTHACSPMSTLHMSILLGLDLFIRFTTLGSSLDGSHVDGLITTNSWSSFLQTLDQHPIRLH